ncbi:MAG: SpoVR family protein, partial [Planctomycetes bacterium]|nr:SpoVR family protein [Planctomycetota bacterium]
MSLKYTRKAWLAAGWLHVGDRLVLPRVPVPVSAGSSSGHGFSFIAEHAESSCGDEEHLYPQICEVTTQDYDGYVYNFSVEEDESYTLAAGMVVHNCDFFKNNAYFAHTNRKMMDEMANHGTRIRRYAEKHGEDEVEAFMDRCMSIDDLIDVHSTAIRRRDLQSRYDFAEAEEEDSPKLTRFKSKGYMDTYINPREALKAEEEERKKVKDHAARTFPEHPEKDVLLFLIEHAPLKPWQRDVLSIVRDEAYYFAPQAQTKVMNEGWACLKAGSLVNTDRGLLPIEEIVQQRLVVQVSDGQDFRQVYDWARFEDRETVYLRTRRGLELEGSRTHQVMFPDGSWRRLDEVRVGDRLLLSSGLSAWPKEPVPIAWQPPRRLVLTEVAARAGVDVETVIRFRRGVRGRFSDRLAPLVAEYEAGRAAWGRMQNNRRQLAMPRVLDEKLAAFLGYLVGDGHLSQVKRTIGLTTGDEDQADRFVELTRELFGLTPRKHWDEGRWRVGFSSRNIEAYLQALGLKTGFAARVKEVPAGILRSPREVVAAFLRA